MASTPTEWRIIHCPGHQDPRYSTRSICPSCHYPRSVPVCCMFKTEAHIPEEEQHALAAQSWTSGASQNHGHHRSANSIVERVFPPLATEFKNLSLVRHRNPCFSIIPFFVGQYDPSCSSLYAFLEDFRLPPTTMTIMVVREPAVTSSHNSHGSSGAQLPVWLRTAFLRVRYSIEIQSADSLFNDVQQRLVFRNCNAPDPLDEGLVRLACLDPAATHLLGSVPWEGRAVSAHGVMGIPSWPVIYPSSGPFPSISSQTRGQRPTNCKATVTAYLSISGVPRWWIVANGLLDVAVDRSDPSLSPIIMAYGVSVSFEELAHNPYRESHGETYGG